ncbi:hypothetical protein AM484_002319 [Pseudomonas aeruginosa]|nr:hypothetical protein AM484_002319 [Pseudomonas aeruginosa]
MAAELNQFVEQQGDVFHPLAQRRHLDGEYVEAVVEVFAESAVLDHLLEVLVGRGDDPHVDVLRLVAADPFEGALLQHAQQLDLHRQRHVADLVEEQGAAVGQLEASGTTGDGTGEGALLVAEQFAFQQFRRDRPAVHRDEGPLAALGMVMQVARHHFLAGAGLAEDQHAGIGIGDLLHHLPHLLDRPAGADQAAEQVRLAGAAALAGLVVHLAVDLGAMQGIEQLVVAGRHLQAGEHPAAQLLRPVGRGRLADQQDRQVLVPTGQLLQQLYRPALRLDAAEQHAQGFATVAQARRYLSPILAVAGQLIFAEEVENDCQVATAIEIVVNQQEFGFAPHFDQLPCIEWVSLDPKEGWD